MSRWIALLLLAACPPFPDEGPYKCEQDCTPCIPKTCAEFEGQCGQQFDGCGGAIECGCAAPFVCGVSGLCVCDTKTCADYSVECGRLDDGCGSTIECDCVLPDTCGGEGTAGICGCTPQLCEVGDCAGRDDGCGGHVVCGLCASPEFCSENACGQPAACAGLSCGFVADEFCGTCGRAETCGVAGPNGCGRPAGCTAECGFDGGLFCGGCGQGELCDAGRCVPSVRPFCWSDPEPIQNLDAWTGLKALPVSEGGDLWLYGSYDVSGTNDPGCGRHMRVRLTDYAVADPSTFEQLGSSDFSNLEPGGCAPTGRECDGWVSTPRMVGDGLEMVLDSSYACADYEDQELYISVRAGFDAPWSLPARLPQGEYRPTPRDGVGNPLILDDRRTMLYFANDGPGGAISVARRSSEIPGDLGFVNMERVVVETSTNTASVRPSSVSCDGLYLIYYRVMFWDLAIHEPRISRIVTLEPFKVEASEPYDAAPSLQNNRRGSVRDLKESPDCGALYYGTRSNGTFVRRRVPCP